jgi:ribosome biogenesis GTPase
MNLVELGWRPDPGADGPRLEPGEALGRVAVEHRGGYVVLTESGEHGADLAGRLRHDARNGEAPGLPAVGDWVVCRPDPGGGRAVIRAVLPRRGVFVRKEAGRASSPQVAAAHVDVALLVTAMAGDLNPRRTERYVAMAREGGVTPVVVLTKADLADDRVALDAARARASGAAPGVPFHAVSALTGQGLADLGVYFEGQRTVALLGSSGVGKSTLINRLLGREAQRVSDVRGDGRGRHTTTHRALIPRPGGGLLIDTPGMRELALWGGDEGVQAAFPEVEDFAVGCRFGDCSHTSEPGCAVRAAVLDGALPADRLGSYHKLRGEVRYLEARQDAQARHHRKREDKAKNRALYRWLDEKRW